MRLVGVDEVGRGPLAGPVFAAAVYLTDGQIQNLTALGLRDSKKLTERKREKLFVAMLEQGVAFGLGWAKPAVIDRLNILNATFYAMRTAVRRLGISPDGLVVDGNRLIPELDCFQQAVVGGDDLYPQISAASVIAKVLRDRLMVALDRHYPGYGFREHKGYGTASHRSAILRLGPCALHRRSFKW